MIVECVSCPVPFVVDAPGSFRPDATADVVVVVIDRAEVLDKERRKMLTSLLVNSGLDEAIVLATSERKYRPRWCHKV